VGYCHSRDGDTLFSQVVSNKLRVNVKNQITFICANADADPIKISKVTTCKNKLVPLFGLSCITTNAAAHDDDEYCRTNAMHIHIGLNTKSRKRPSIRPSVRRLWTRFMDRSSPNLEHRFPVSYRSEDFLCSSIKSSIRACANIN